MSHKATLLATLFPHLFLPTSPPHRSDSVPSHLKNVTRYRIENKEVASAYHIGGTSEKRERLYETLIADITAKEQITTDDIIIQWLYLSSGISNSCTSYILKLITQLDQERHEEIFPNINLVFTNESATTAHQTTLIDSLNYLCRINFSAEVYIVLSHDFKILSTQEIPAAASKEHAFNVPKAFAPYATLFHSRKSAPLLTLHYQSNGDLFLLGKEHYSGNEKFTMLASRRNRQWHCYDMDLLEKLFRARFNNNNIGKTLLKIAFELSHEHHGGLIIYDQSRLLHQQHILNAQSSDVQNSHDPFIQNLSQLIRSTPKKALSVAPHKMQILKNLMTLDGCVIFNDEGLQSVGSLLSIQTRHDNKAIEQELQSIFTTILGGRNAASLYANALGCIALKISQNGTITFYTRYYKQTVTLEFL